MRRLARPRVRALSQLDCAGRSGRRLQCGSDRPETSIRPARGTRMPCCSRKAVRPMSSCSNKAGSIAIRALHPGEAMFTFWDYMRHRWERDAGLRLDQLLLNSRAAPALRASGVDRACTRPSRKQAITLRSGRSLAALPNAGPDGNAAYDFKPAAPARETHRLQTTKRRSPAPDAAGCGGPLLVVRRRFLRASRLPCAAKIHPPRWQPRRRRDPRLCEFPVAVLPNRIGHAPCSWLGTRSPRRPTGTSCSPPIRAGESSTMSSSSNSTTCRSSWPPAASPMPRRAGYEADDFLAAAVKAEERRGGTVLVASGDRDTFQLASARTAILYPVRAGRAGTYWTGRGKGTLRRGARTGTGFYCAAWGSLRSASRRAQHRRAGRR